MKNLCICPRCKRRSLDMTDCGESGIYQSAHLICSNCWGDEFEEIDLSGTNDLPDTLAKYGPANNS